MASPTPRRKTATELEQQLSAGATVDPQTVVAAVDQPMHNELAAVFRSQLSSDERAELISDVIVELLTFPKKYDSSRSSLVCYVRMRVRCVALDYLARRTKTRRQQESFQQQGLLHVAPPDLPGPLESAENAAAYAAAAERVAIELLRLSRNQKLAVEAYQQHGPSRYASVLALQLGVSPNVVSQWFTRAKKRIQHAIGNAINVFE